MNNSRRQTPRHTPVETSGSAGGQKAQHPMPQRGTEREGSEHGSPSPQAQEQPSEGAFSCLPSSNCSQVGPLIQAVSL